MSMYSELYKGYEKDDYLMQNVQIGDIVQWRGHGVFPTNKYEIVGFTENDQGATILIIKDGEKTELTIHPSYLKYDVKTTRKLKLKKIYR